MNQSSMNPLTYPLVICDIAIENGHRNSGFTLIYPLKMVDLSIVMLVYRRVNHVQIGHFTWLCEVKGSGGTGRHRVESQGINWLD